MDTCDIKCIHADKVEKAERNLPGPEDIRQVAEIFKSLSDPSRLKIVMALRDQELCVCDIAAVCRQSDSAVSHQLRLLRSLNVVKTRRDGKIVYYSLDDDHVISLIHQTLFHVMH